MASPAPIASSKDKTHKKKQKEKKQKKKKKKKYDTIRKDEMYDLVAGSL